MAPGADMRSWAVGRVGGVLGGGKEIFGHGQVGDVPGGWARTVKANGVLMALTMSLQTLMHLVHFSQISLQS